MSIHAKLKLHIERHMYKRGKNKGQAPLDGDRRSRTHERVRKLNDGSMAVRMHDTDVIVVRPDDSFTVNCDGWFSAPATRNCVNDAFHKFGIPASIYNGSKFSKTQQIIKVKGEEHRYYDGIAFSPSGALASTPKPFEAKRIDKSETKAFHDGMKESGFKAVFKILHATTASEHEGVSTTTRSNRGYPEWLRDALTDKDCADMWPLIVRQFAFRTAYDFRTRKWTLIKNESTETWANIMKAAKGDLYETVIAK